MKKYSNPLDNIKIASPCPADWNEMHGDARQRHCSQCNLNVYNLSDMTLREAESFLINSEGGVCVNYYRRRDGTVLTRDCPVGWALVKKRVSRAATAVFASLFGLFTGLFAFHQFDANPLDLRDQVVVETDNSIVDEPSVQIGYDESRYHSVRGRAVNLKEIKNEIRENLRKDDPLAGQVINPQTLKKERVVAWIE